MTYEIRDLVDIKNRKVVHINQLRENSNPENKYFLLKGQKNTFHVESSSGRWTIARPFETEIKEPLNDLVAFALENCASVNLIGFPKKILDSFYFTLNPDGGSNQSLRLYQTPKTSKEYNSKLKKFRNSGFSYRELGGRDIENIRELETNWAQNKKSRGLDFSLPNSISGVQEINSLIRDLIKIKGEVNWLDYIVKDPSEYEKLMGQTLTKFYGTFRDGELLAYLRTEGNDSFQVFHSRASVRESGCSPQEFLDYSVAREFVKRGVKNFDRGWINFCKGMIGLIEYKKKFGKLKPTFELDWGDVVALDSPENRYMQDFFNSSND